MARSAEVGTTPVPVGAGGGAYVVVRLRPGGEVSAFPARCPHRLVPLATGSVVDGRLRCPAHGWGFDTEGRCVDIPSLGEHGAPPPRAELPAIRVVATYAVLICADGVGLTVVGDDAIANAGRDLEAAEFTLIVERDVPEVVLAP